MKIGFLFPGQGSQCVGMGKDIFEKYDVAKDVYNNVEKITGVDIKKISFDGPEEELNRTKYTQLAVLANSLAVLEVLKNNGINAEVSAGLSLGEYSALIYSGMLDFNDGVKIVQKRGQFMEELVPDGEWKMAAVLGLSDEDVIDACKKVKNGFAVPANFNCKGQVAVSGDTAGIQELEKIAKEMGARKVMILNTSGPFHTEKLIDASKKLGEELQKINFNKGNSKVIKNIDGTEYSSKDNVKEILEKHIISPVMFSKTLQKMLDEGVDTFVEVGPGRILSGFAKRTPTDKNVNILNTNNVEKLEETIKFVKEAL